MDFSDYPFDDHTCNFQVVFIEFLMIIKLMSGCSGWKLFLWQKLSHLLFYIPGWPPSPPISSSTQSSPSDITILTPFNCSPFILTTLGNALSHINNSEHYRAPKRDQIEQVLSEHCSTPLTLGICHGQKELSGMRRMVMMMRGLLPTTIRLASGQYAACGFQIYLQRKHQPLIYQVNIDFTFMEAMT